MAIEPGRHLSHYRLERKLGQGGMGEVWLAEDLALGRRTAIKLLSDELSGPLRARLRREGLNFSWVLIGSNEVSLNELARAATVLGRDDLARELLDRARKAGLTGLPCRDRRPERRVGGPGQTSKRRPCPRPS